MRRPLLISHTGEPGGSNAVLLALLERAPGGVEPACVFLDDGPAVAAARALGIPTAVVPTGRVRELHLLPRVVRRLRGAIRRHDADGTFAHTAKAQLVGGAAAALEHVPAVWWQHAVPGQEPFGRFADRMPAAAVITSSAWTADLQRSRTRAPVHVVHPGTAASTEPAAPHTDEPVIGSVGRLQRWKRVELLLRAMPAVLAQVPEARLEIVGGGDPRIDPEYPSELRALAGALGVAHAVTFTGHVTDGAARMAGYAVLAHAAGEEPFGLVVLEALTRGVPVVGPDRGGAAEIVRDGIDGLLVDVEDAGAFAAALVALLRDPAHRAAMGAAGRARVAERFSVERMAAETWSLLARAR